MVNKMAEIPGNDGSEDRKMGKATSFKKLLGSPSRSNSKNSKGSSNSLTKLLFGRKSSRSNMGDNEGEPTDIDSDEKDTSLLEQTKEVLVTTIEEVINSEKKQPLAAEQTDNTTRSVESKEPSSDQIKETKSDLLGKLKVVVGKAKDEIDKAAEGLKEGFEKAKEGTKIEEAKVSTIKEEASAIVNEGKSTSNELLNEVKAPNLVQRIKEEVVAVKSTIATKEGETHQEENKEKVENKEDDCVSTLAQGLQNLCAPWSSKKD